MKYIVSVNSKALKEITYKGSKSKLVDRLVREYLENEKYKQYIDLKILTPLEENKKR